MTKLARLALLLLSLSALSLQPLSLSASAATPALRPPAVPLVACDPYFSIWSQSDKLTGIDTSHWTGRTQRISSQILVDGKPFRILGQAPETIRALAQKSLTVLPTRTIYTFEDPQRAPVRLTLTFMTPTLPDNIDILSRPVTYITYAFESLDGKTHDIAIQFNANGDLTVNDSDKQDTVGSLPKIPGLATASLGAKDQLVLQRNGDGIRIEWGYLYLSADAAQAKAALSLGSDYLESFGTTNNIRPTLSGPDQAKKVWATLRFAPFKIGAAGSGIASVPPADEGRPDPRPSSATAPGGTTSVSSAAPASPGGTTSASSAPPAAASPPLTPPSALQPFSHSALSSVSSAPTTRTVILAYDDLYSIQYLGKNLRPYWRRDGWQAADLLAHSAADYDTLRQRCETFDAELMTDLANAGGEKYAALAALCYRQCFAAGKFVADEHGQPLSFCKENHSNGCIGTSDVFYPMSPLFLLSGPTVAKSFIVPFMNYAASPRWKFPFAPHDLGRYPHANGQVYGGKEQGEQNQMPVEESGNLLILFGAIAQMEGNADFASLYWPTLEKWAQYLKTKGFDPESQLCTDDFAGHLAHNVNLSIKAIMGLGSFAKLCDLRGDKTKAQEYWKLARAFAQRWVREADDGDHYRLAFDKPGTWSQKYNLVWDRILNLNLFPKEVARKEMDFYLRNQYTYGLPLDSRKTWAKLDWTLWTATLTQNRADFEAIANPVYDFANRTDNRQPLTDHYFTEDARKYQFTARPVVGGVFLQLLYDKTLWDKYASRDVTKAANYAPLPKGYMDARTDPPPRRK